MTQSSPDKPYATTFVTANIWKKLTKGKWQKLKLQGSSLSTERIKAATSQQQSKTISNVLPNLSNYACVKALCESCQANNKTNRDSTRPVSTLVKHITYLLANTVLQWEPASIQAITLYWNITIILEKILW